MFEFPLGHFQGHCGVAVFCLDRRYVHVTCARHRKHHAYVRRYIRVTLLLPSVFGPPNVFLPLPCTRLKMNTCNTKDISLRNRAHLAFRGCNPKRYSSVAVYPTENIIYMESQKIALRHRRRTLPPVDAPQNVLFLFPHTRPKS